MQEVSEALAARNGIRERLIVDGYYEIHEGLDSYAGRSLYEGLEFYVGRTAAVMRTSLGENEGRIRWDAAFHPHIEPAAFEKLWAGGEPVLFITRWAETAPPSNWLYIVFRTVSPETQIMVEESVRRIS